MKDLKDNEKYLKHATQKRETEEELHSCEKYG